MCTAFAYDSALNYGQSVLNWNHPLLKAIAMHHSSHDRNRVGNRPWNVEQLEPNATGAPRREYSLSQIPSGEHSSALQNGPALLNLQAVEVSQMVTLSQLSLVYCRCAVRCVARL